MDIYYNFKGWLILTWFFFPNVGLFLFLFFLNFTSSYCRKGVVPKSLLSAKIFRKSWFDKECRPALLFPSPVAMKSQDMMVQYRHHFSYLPRIFCIFFKRKQKIIRMLEGISLKNLSLKMPCLPIV